MCIYDITSLKITSRVNFNACIRHCTQGKSNNKHSSEKIQDYTIAS